jgi:hypothetical protein
VATKNSFPEIDELETSSLLGNTGSGENTSLFYFGNTGDCSANISLTCQGMTSTFSNFTGEYWAHSASGGHQI